MNDELRQKTAKAMLKALSKWKEVGGSDFVMSKGNFVFRLQKVSAGVGSMGSAYSLRARKIEEVKETCLGYSFWVTRDGGYNSYQSDSVDGKIWTKNETTIPDIYAIQKEAEKILEQLKFI